MPRPPTIAILALLLGGCADDPTQVAVRIVTDLGHPAEFDSLQLEIRRPGDMEPVRQQDVFEGLASPRGRGFREVASFGVVPRDGDASRGFEVRVKVRRGVDTLFTTRAVTGFVSGRTIRLDVYAPSRCIGVVCQEDETCGVSGCVDPEVDPTVLEPGLPATPPDGDDARGGPDHTSACGSRVDLDGDGAPELLVGAPEASAGRGEVHVFEVGSGSVATWDHRLIVSDVAGDGARFGALVDAGDVDGDGLADLLVGADGVAPALTVIRAAGGSTRRPLAPDRLASVAFVGDVDGDGFGDAAWVALDADSAATLFVAPGRPTGLDLDGAYRRTPLSGEITVGDATVHGLGDLDGDGLADLAVAMPDTRGGGVVVMFGGSPSGPVLTEFLVGDASAGAGFGAAVRVGDLDGDGRCDLVIGSPGFSEGRGGVVVRLQEGPNAFVEHTLVGVPASRGFGRAIAVLDIDGDGHDDLATGDDLPVEEHPQLMVALGGPRFLEGETGASYCTGPPRRCELLAVPGAARPFGEALTDISSSAARLAVRSGDDRVLVLYPDVVASEPALGGVEELPNPTGAPGFGAALR